MTDRNRNLHLNTCASIPSWMIENSDDGDVASENVQGTCEQLHLMSNSSQSMAEHSNVLLRENDSNGRGFIDQKVWVDSYGHEMGCNVSSSSDFSQSTGPINWEELTHVGSAAVKEMLRTAIGKSVHIVQKSISQIKNGSKLYSDLGSISGFSIEFENGLLDEFDIASHINREYINSESNHTEKSQNKVLRANELPPFSSLPWIDRQLVSEWRTLSVRNRRTQDIDSISNMSSLNGSKNLSSPKDSSETKSDLDSVANIIVLDDNDAHKRESVAIALDISVENCNSTVRENHGLVEEFEQSLELEFDLARSRIPKPLSTPIFRNALRCFTCDKSFFNSSSGMIRRHHCRLCARSFCGNHSRFYHKLPHIGYDSKISERVCEACKRDLDQRDFAERTLWRIARCRDFFQVNLIPYFEPGIDSAEDIAWRITQGAITAAKRIPLGAQAYVAIETVDNLRKHGLKGIYALVLRKEFMAAADLLRKVTGIEKNFPLSAHDLTAAIFYALAQHKAVRGNDPEREQLIHSFKKEINEATTECLEKKKSQICYSNESQSSHIDSRLNLLPHIGTECSETSLSTQSEENSRKERFDSMIDENDQFDPLSKSISNLLSLADEAIQSNNLCHCTLEENEDDTERKIQKNTSMHKLPFTPVCEPVGK